MSNTFYIAPAPEKAVRHLRAVSLLLLMIAAVAAYLASTVETAAFDWWVTAASALLTAGLGLMFWRDGCLARNRKIRIAAHVLHVQGLLGDRRIPIDALLLDHAAVLDLSEHHHLQPATRTRGLHIAGYRAGWFTTADGTSALVYLTCTDRTVHLPTSRGYHLLASVNDPEALLAALRAVPVARRRTSCQVPASSRERWTRPSSVPGPLIEGSLVPARHRRCGGPQANA